jgi:hypothetical protein
MSSTGWKTRFVLASAVFLLGMTTGIPTQAGDAGGSLHLFVNPSAKRIDWGTPRSLLWSTIKSTVASQAGAATGARETALGHVVVHFDCRDLDGKQRSGWVGMSGQNDSDVDKRDLLDNQIGMKLLFKLYSDGELVSDQVSRDQVATNPGRLEWDGWVPRKMHSKFLRFEVNPDQCSEIWDYVSTYRERSYDHSMPLDQWRKLGPDRILYYGFPIREPIENFRRVRAGEKGVRLGGGCTAYGVSFLKLLGVHSEDFEQFFARRFSVSEALIGKKDPATGERQKVSVFDILFGRVGSKWNHAGIADRPLDIYDPQLMWDFIDGVQSCARKLGLEGAAGVKAYRKTCTPEILEWTRAHASSIAPNEELVLSAKVAEERNGRTVWRNEKVVRHGVAFR